MTLRVTVDRNALFPNPTLLCEEVRKRAEEMGIRKPIVIRQSKSCRCFTDSSWIFSPAYLYLSKRVSRWLQNFPKEVNRPGSIIEFSQEYTIRHELSHVFYEDSPNLKIIAVVVPIIISILRYFPSIFGGSVAAQVSAGALIPFSAISWSLFVNKNFVEKKADAKAFTYLSAEEKMKTMGVLKKLNRFFNMGFETSFWTLVGLKFRLWYIWSFVLDKHHPSTYWMMHTLHKIMAPGKPLGEYAPSSIYLEIDFATF
jgi:hypothetical protein